MGGLFERPVNYALVRIVPPETVEIDPTRRPFVVVDPRAGHGPGIGGFKAESEIGVALRAGHPCYFVGFLPEPVPGQTIEDMARAEAIFLQKVIDLHPDADGKPCIMGNCQAGWAVMMLAAIRPELFGPIIVAGVAALLLGRRARRKSHALHRRACWAAAGWPPSPATLATENSMARGLCRTSRISIHRIRFGASNTTFTPRSTQKRHAILASNAGGAVTSISMPKRSNSLSTSCSSGTISRQAISRTAMEQPFDLRNIRSPIVVFCSKGDNITPPPQALGWILDLYEDVDEIRSYGQTIVYTIHESVGHLGIFVSSGMARKEHGEFSSNIDLIDTLPPGLYEAIFESKIGRHGQSRSGLRRLGDALRGEDARRYPQAGRQRRIR